MDHEKESNGKTIKIKFQIFYREVCPALPIGFSRQLPLTINLDKEIKVIISSEVNRDSEEENLLIITSYTKQLSLVMFNLLKNPILPWESEGADLITIPLLGSIDEKLLELAGTLQTELDLISSKTAHLIGWRHKLFGFPHRLKGTIVHLRWGLPNDELSMPPFFNNSFPTGIMKLPSVEIWNQKLTLANVKNPEAPLYYELLNEAVLALKTSPKSSLVMFIAALETAIKQYIATAAPQTEWLIREMQSPPVYKLYGIYLEQLPSLNKRIDNCIAVPKRIKKRIEHFVQKRNEIVHGKEVNLDFETLTEIKELTITLLYYVDWLLGEDWAFDFIHPDIKTLLPLTLNDLHD